MIASLSGAIELPSPVISEVIPWKKIVAFATLSRAKLVSVAKVQHVLYRLPRVTPDLNVTISVIGPRHNFDEVETWHYWSIAIEDEQLSVSSGGLLQSEHGRGQLHGH